MFMADSAGSYKKIRDHPGNAGQDAAAWTAAALRAILMPGPRPLDGIWARTLCAYGNDQHIKFGKRPWRGNVSVPLTQRPRGGIDQDDRAQEETMINLSVEAVPFVLLASVFTVTAASAEERCKLSWESAAGTSKYIQQLNIDVRDMPGHQVGVFELHRSYPDAKANCEGYKFAESWHHGLRDVVDRNGRVWGHVVYILDNGYKIFAEISGTVQTEVGADGTARTIYDGAGTWTGGTGRYASVRGIQREHLTVEYVPGGGEVRPSSGSNNAEYWFDK
jgi:hypothetical protein